MSFSVRRLKKPINFILCIFFFILFSFSFTTTDIPEESNYSFAYLNVDNVKIEKSKPILVVIDPGHGGEDLGAYYGDLLEKNLNTDICLMLGDMLKNEKIDVIFTRDTDKYVDVKERARFANSLNATLFISVHCNKMDDNPIYRGTETLYSVQGENVNSKMDGKKLATIVQSELVKALKTYNIGIIYRPDLAVLHRTNMPAVIAEIAYISNSKDRRNLCTESFREKAARALCNAVKIALNEMEEKPDESRK